MIRLFIALSVFAALFACNTKTTDNRILLNSETENTVKLGDTMVIFTGACKGCEFETTYGFTDSLGIIKKNSEKRSDVCPKCDGGSYKVEIEFVPLKEGKTVLKMYVYEWRMSDSVYVPEILSYERKPIIVDSALFSKFIINVKNK